MYVAARKLHIGYQEWENLPWWAQRAYIEGMIDEELLSFDTAGQQEVDPVMASDAALKAMGLRVIDGGRV